MTATSPREHLLYRVESVVAVLLLAAIVTLVSVASIARAVGHPIIWSVEVAQLCFVWLCVLAADLALQRGRHFSLSILADSLSPRSRACLQIVNHLVLLVLLAFLLNYAWRNMLLMHPRLVGATQMHGSWIHASMVLGFCLFLRTLACQLVQLLANGEWRGSR